METNIGMIDRIIRGTMLIISAVVYIAEILTGFAGAMVGFVAIFCFATALTRYCPIWEMLGISTEKTIHRIIPR
jgi:hypothetical protein